MKTVNIMLTLTMSDEDAEALTPQRVSFLLLDALGEYVTRRGSPVGEYDEGIRAYIERRYPADELRRDGKPAYSERFRADKFESVRERCHLAHALRCHAGNVRVTVTDAPEDDR